MRVCVYVSVSLSVSQSVILGTLDPCQRCKSSELLSFSPSILHADVWSLKHFRNSLPTVAARGRSQLYVPQRSAAAHRGQKLSTHVKFHASALKESQAATL